jgi:hypothetical protein
MQITNYGKRFIQYISYGYLNGLQKSTKMLRKTISAQNRTHSAKKRTTPVRQRGLIPATTLTLSDFEKSNAF